MSETLTCPVCKSAVAGTSSMCLNCHLPIRDVRVNQPRMRRAPRTRAVSRWLGTRVLGVVLYGGLSLACAIAAPAYLPYVAPAAMIGLYFHLLRGRPWRAILVSTFVAGTLVFAAQVVNARPNGGDDPSTGSPPSDEQVTYREPKVIRVNDRFAGTIELTNHTNVHANILVSVHIYDNEQDIGELHGDVSLKPHSSAQVDLWSSDDYRQFNDTVVELLGLPAAVG